MVQNFEQVRAINGKMTAYNCEMFNDHDHLKTNVVWRFRFHRVPKMSQLISRSKLFKIQRSATQGRRGERLMLKTESLASTSRRRLFSLALTTRSNYRAGILHLHKKTVKFLTYTNGLQIHFRLIQMNNICVSFICPTRRQCATPPNICMKLVGELIPMQHHGGIDKCQLATESQTAKKKTKCIITEIHINFNIIAVVSGNKLTPVLLRLSSLRH